MCGGGGIFGFCFLEKFTSAFYRQSVNGNLYVILENLKNPTSKQMVADIL